MLILDSTMAKAYSRCPAQYDLKYIQNLRKIDSQDDLSLRWGEAIHKGLEAFTGQSSQLQAMIDAFKGSFIETIDDVNHKYYNSKNTATGIHTLTEFIPFYKNNFSHWDTLQVEETGDMMIGDDIKYLCKIDRVIKNRGNIYVVDFKTTSSRPSPTYFNRFKLDFQASGYTQWCKEKYGQCAGFIPIVMFVGYRSRKYKDEPVGFHVKFDYSIIDRTQEQLDWFNKDLQKIAKEINTNKRDGFFRKAPTACEFFGCQYNDLCDQGYDECLKESLYEVYDSTQYLHKEA